MSWEERTTKVREDRRKEEADKKGWTESGKRG
jgi:hypothetical protein